MAQNDATNCPSREKSPAEVTTTCKYIAVDIPVGKNSRSPGASKYPPGLRLTSSGKWGVQLLHPFKRKKIWLGSYTTVEEATNIYNQKKLEYASLRSKLCKEDASLTRDESEPHLATSTEASLTVAGSNSTADRPNCIVMALSRKKSGCFSVQNSLENLCMFKKYPHEISSSAKQNDFALATPTQEDIPVVKKSRSLGAEKHPGLQVTASGKYGVKIRHPITGSRIWLGSYSTIEKAKDIYNTKNLEYASLRPTVINEKKHSMLKLKDRPKKGKPKRNGKHKRQKLVIGGITVWETSSGKWGASIRDPILKIKVWLGSHATPEEAMESYNKKKLEFYPSYDSELLETETENGVSIPACDVADVCIPACDVADVCTPVHDKWRVAVSHRLLKHLILLGTYDTIEEAEKVYNRNKLELDAMLHSKKYADFLTDVGSEGGHVKKYTGVRASGRGRWMSQIQSPISRKNKVHLGTFRTAEAAAEAFNRMRREFDAIVSLVKKRKHEAESKSKKPLVLEQDGMPIDERTRLFEIMVESPSCNPDSAINMVSSQECNDNQLIGLSAAEQEFGMHVIDSYGQLVGEYSRLDDELWL